MKEENIAEQYFFPPSSVPAKALEVKHLLIFKNIEFNYPNVSLYQILQICFPSYSTKCSSNFKFV